MEKKDVFISYSRKDTKVADKVCEAFDLAGISYFIDRKGIAGGMEFPDVLAEAIKNCKLFLLLASENSYVSKYTKREINFAFNEMSDNSLLPYIIDDSTLPDGMRLMFSSINWRNIKDHPIDTVLVKDVIHLLGRQEDVSIAELSNSKEEKKGFFSKIFGGFSRKEKPTEDPDKLFEKAEILNSSAMYTEAVKLYQKAADMGHVAARDKLGLCYYTGEGVKRDYILAARWFLLAAEKGNKHSQFSLGNCYVWGHGVEKDYAESIKWYRKAAEQGHAKAQYALGTQYRDGKGVEKNYSEAAKWYLKAAEQKHPDAQREMGIFYYLGNGVAKDYEQSLRWSRLAAAQGDRCAQNNVGVCYINGRGVEKSPEEAVKWFLKSAEQGYATGQDNLAKCYENGRGVAKDLKEAERWYRKAAEKGNSHAKEALDKLAKATSSAASSSGSRVGRNDPCPCGSGKKYKDCHGRQL